MRRLKIGVIGCANIAIRSMIPAILNADSFHLYGIASRSWEKAKRYADIFKTRPYEGYNELLNEKLDAVYIPLPNSLHYEWVKKALNKNINVLVEKSLACTLKEVVELNALAKERDLVLLENFQFRFHAQLRYIEKLVESNKIGELRNIRASFGFPPFSDEKNIRYLKELGGGALLDAGAYPLKISQIFLGENLYVDGASMKYSPDREIDIWGSAYIKQKEKELTAHVSFGFDNYYQNKVELWGSKGTITASRIFTAPPDYRPSIQIESDGKTEIIEIERDDHYKNILIHFYNLVSTKSGLAEEYRQNITQARLLSELKIKATSGLN